MNIENDKTDSLVELSVVDPDLAETVIAGLKKKNFQMATQHIAMLVEETLWALSQEISFGHSVAMGYVDLLGDEDPEKITQYKNLVREFGNQGSTLGKIMATHLVPVLKFGDERFLERFLRVVDIMLAKGTYALNSPLQLLSVLLEDQDLASGSAYLDLLGETFSKNLSYVQCQNFAHTLPQAVSAFPTSKRIWQIDQLRHVIKAEFRLADPFLDGLKKGLDLLSSDALNKFVSIGLNKLKYSRRKTAKFLSLESKLGIDTFTDMQVAVPISQVQHQMNRYLRARTGMTISVRPMSSLPKVYVEEQGVESLVCSDGNFIYLPSEIDRFSNKAENITLYKCLVKLEAGHYEFNTFDFDLEKVMERRQGNAQLKDDMFEFDPIQNLKSEIQNREDLSDLERFFSSFPIKVIASDLFTIFEHGRIRVMMNRQYPGLIKQALPLLRWEAERMFSLGRPVGSVFMLYLWIALGISDEKSFEISNHIRENMKIFVGRFEKKIEKDQTVEACAELVAEAYQDIVELLKQSEGVKNLEEHYIPLRTPFGRKIRPDLFFSAFRKYENLAKKLKINIEEKGFKIYKSDIKRRLVENNGFVSHKDLKNMICYSRKDDRSHYMGQQNIAIDLSWLDLSKFFGKEGISLFQGDDFSGSTFWYREWDCNLMDYIQAHVRVLDKLITSQDGDFYDLALKRYRGLIKRIRYAFEFLKPEGLVRLRQWVEGDEFDYRAMLDYAVDKKAKKIPSDRLYIKRIKQLRDVAVLLLVDLSRSTANSISNSQVTVMDIEKEAIVLFCEGLDVVGDAFAIAGFSGTGRLGVDYLRIKEFDEKMDDAIKSRINAMAPRRSTRMGAAIRHATSQMEGISSKVRLLIILSDGFPNDVDYKQNYAVEDTRKAIFEARSKNIYTHAITINIAGDSRLDDLYGNVHHNVISDVRELPDKLLRIYSRLTQN